MYALGSFADGPDRMDIKQLRCFVAAVETGNFTRASEQVHIAQSAFSRQIANLEAALGVALFDRRGRGVELTPEGRDAYGRARKLLADFGAFQRDVSLHHSDKAARKISLAAHGGLGPLFLPQVARTLCEAGESIQFHLAEALSEHIERRVSSGECDIGIVIRRTGFDVERANLETIKLAEEDMFAVRASDEGGLIGEEWTAAELLRHPLILAPTGSLERTSHERWAKVHGVDSLKVIGEAETIALRIAMVRQLGGACILPGIALPDLLPPGNWRVHRLAKDSYFNGSEWFVIYRRTEGDRLIRQIVAVMRRAAADLSDRSMKALAYGF